MLTDRWHCVYPERGPNCLPDGVIQDQCLLHSARPSFDPTLSFLTFMSGRIHHAQMCRVVGEHSDMIDKRVKVTVQMPVMDPLMPNTDLAQLGIAHLPMPLFPMLVLVLSS